MTLYALIADFVRRHARAVEVVMTAAALRTAEMFAAEIMDGSLTLTAISA